MMMTPRGVVYASIQNIVAPGVRGTAMAVYFLFMYLGGASFGPVLTGKLSDRLAARAAAAAGSSNVTEALKGLGLPQALLAKPPPSRGLAPFLWVGVNHLRVNVARR